MKCCTCSKWIDLRCSLLSFSRFRTPGSSRFWSFLHLLRLCFFWRSHTYQHRDFLFGLLQLVYLLCSIWPIWSPSANAALPPHPGLQISYPPSAHPISCPSAPLPPLHVCGCSSTPPVSSSSLTSSGFFNGMLGVSEPEALNCYFLSSHPVDLICIQESNLSSSSSFRIPGFSTLRVENFLYRTHSRSGILSPDTTHASSNVIIFVRQGLPFSKLSSPLFLCLTPTLFM